MKEELTLEYHGPVVKTGSMDAFETASNILAFREFIGILSKNVYGEQIDLQTDIQGFRGESFDIDFALTIGGSVANILFSELGAKDIIGLTLDCVKAWIHLNGSPPKSIEPTNDNSNNLDIENQNGEIININVGVLNIITNPKASKATEQFVKKQLENGIDKVGIKSRTCDKVVSIDKKDSKAFIPIDIEKPLLENEMKIGVVIESASFKEGNKWKFYDGQNSFYAELLDEDFLSKIDDGRERFGKGDVLLVTLRIIQKQIPSGLKTDRLIVKVHEHKTPNEQLSML